MNKRGIVLVVVFLLAFFLINFVYATTNSSQNSTNLDKAYQCIQNKTGDDCSKLTVDEQASVLLSKGNYKNCVDAFLKNSDNQQCWPSGNCNIKSTSIALLALDRAGQNTDTIKAWLLNRSKVASDLTWYIQIDSSSATSCKVSYDTHQYTVQIDSSKQVLSGAGSCLSVSENNFWLKISSNCLDKSYTISCDKDFTSTLLYKSSTSDTIHVSQNLHTEVSGGESIEQVTYMCFKSGPSCDYEGSLWAILALNKKGVDTSPYIPYLDSLVDQNENLFPEAFLYAITGSDTYLNAIVTNNFKGNFWNVGTYGKYISTALGFIALQSQTSDQVDSAKAYLTNGKTQDINGCWGSVKETGLLLYTGWPSSSSSTTTTTQCSKDSDCGINQKCLNNVCVTTSNQQDCAASGKYCITTSQCNQAQGLIFTNLQCPALGDICCSQNYQVQSCSALSGIICQSDETCNGDSKTASDGLCCLGSCTPIQTQNTTYTCTTNTQNTCTSSCAGTVDTSLTCPGNQFCCQPQQSSTLWIWILLILILIVIIAIIFRKRLQLFYFRIKNNFRKGSGPRENRPPFSPPGAGQRMIPRPMFPVPRQPVQQRAPVRSSKDSEFEETIKKLRDMSK